MSDNPQDQFKVTPPETGAYHRIESRKADSRDDLEKKIEELRALVLDLKSQVDNLRFTGTAQCNDDGTITLTGDIS